MFYTAGIVFAILAMIATVWILPATTRLSPQWSVTLSGVVLLAVAGLAIAGPVRSSRSLIKGVVGERLTADLLESLRADGYEAFHDLRDQTSGGEPCNIDHVIVGPPGVFVIETKYREEAFSGKRISVFPDRIEINGQILVPDPRPQALAALASAKAYLRPVLPVDDVPFRAVLVFPRRKGGGVDHAFQSPDGVWVLTPGALAKTLRKLEKRLSPQQIQAISAALGSAARQESFFRDW